MVNEHLIATLPPEHPLRIRMEAERDALAVAVPVPTASELVEERIAALEERLDAIETAARIAEQA